ncbi:hypothetical protein E4T38_08341 [Aureobasidium subglaciale]|nr:hypothetical protein E4T38_08341 [Aureobasidium subglaciale]KAI5213511.1 hypothetical protein E4T40_09668 [Aureobasidium subglaciale]KAI5215165.1 hypothetical protein E4T41_09706 [Aureobasidium subglaciale]KAI5256428.1 hypothetical protein E4T46_08241 [Aureobasidium subglaciale]
MSGRIMLLFQLCLVFFTALANAAAQEPLVDERPIYSAGDAIPVTCRQLQYVPFPVCNETGRPLEIYFGVEKDINCTIDFISDPMFHLLEFYVHNDAPMTCRIPTRPMPDSSLANRVPKEDASVEGQGSLSDEYIPLIIALTGTLQLSHLHVSSHLNMLLHAAPKSVSPGVIDAATAYSISTRPPARIVIGDALPFTFSIRWYSGQQLPSGWSGVGGHIYASTLIYCILSAGAAAAICTVYFRGVELPRRLRNHGKDRMTGGMEGGRLGGYGYTAGTSSYALGTAGGKRD